MKKTKPEKLSPAERELHPLAAEFFTDIYTLEFLGLPPEHLLPTTPAETKRKTKGASV